MTEQDTQLNTYGNLNKNDSTNVQMENFAAALTGGIADSRLPMRVAS